jgi:hypothetical protein
VGLAEKMGVMPRNLALGRGVQSCVRDIHNESFWRAITCAPFVTCSSCP